MFTPSALDGSVLTENMVFPLNIDLSTLDFKQRLGGLLSRYMPVCKFSHQGLQQVQTKA